MRRIASFLAFFLAKGGLDRWNCRGSQPDATVAKDLLLAEFSHLRQEQFNRTSAQQMLVSFNLTAALALGGIAANQIVQHPGSGVGETLLLLLPPVSFALGLTYYGQDKSIMLIGKYIDDVIRPIAQEIGGDGIFQFERHVRRHERGRAIRFVMTLDMIIIFPGIGMLALTFAAPSILWTHLSPVGAVVWSLETLLELVLIFLWIPAAQRLNRARRRSE